MKTYAPRTGTFVARVIQHLQAHGGTMTALELANGFATPRTHIEGLLARALKHGALVRLEGRPDGKWAYGLPGADATEVAPVPDAALTLSGSPVIVMRKKKEPANQPGTAPEAAAAVTPIAALWEDGDVVLYCGTVNTDGTVTLTEPQAARLHVFLERVYGPVAV